MKQTLEIEVPEGKKAFWKDGKVVFEDITPLPKTWDEFCKLYPIKDGEAYITGWSNITIEDEVLSGRTNNDKNYLPSEEAANQHLALMQLHQLRDCYRQGWVPNWGDAGIAKYTISNSGGGLLILRATVTRSFLSFQTSELAYEFLNNFRDLIIEAGDLI